MKPSEEIRQWGGLDTYKAIDKLDAVADKVEKLEAVVEAAREFINAHTLGIHTRNPDNSPPIKWCEESDWRDMKEALDKLED